MMKIGKEIQTKALETRVTKEWLTDEGIIYSVVIQPNARVTKADTAASLANITKLSQGKKRPEFNDIRKLKNVESESRALGVGEEALKAISAIGFLTNSPVSMTTGNIFLMLNQPPYPTKRFTSEYRAIK